MQKQMLKIFSIFIIFYFSFQSLFANEYFLTLRNDKVNLRQGPSFEYPIKLFYKKKYLPVLVQDKSENFRKYVHKNLENKGYISFYKKLHKLNTYIREKDFKIIKLFIDLNFLSKLIIRKFFGDKISKKISNDWIIRFSKKKFFKDF